MPRHLVLASTSLTRRALLTQVGLPFMAAGSGVPEPLDQTGDARAQARALALSKARAVARQHPEAIVIGADQVLALNGEVFGKAETSELARQMLVRLSGATHSLICGLAVITQEETIIDDEETRLTMHALSTEEVDAYIATNEWQGCAGGYQIEHRGLALFSRVDGDYTNVLGLPMLKLLTILRRLGVRPLLSRP